jgi:hypothetical protein
MSDALQHVHPTAEALELIELTPPHAPRKASAEYNRTHRHLVHDLDYACAICGVRTSTLTDPTKNPFKAKALETHHFPIEFSLQDAVDPAKVHVKFPQVTDQASLIAFIDSPANMLVLCDVHHRSKQFGIHHLAPQDFFVQEYLWDGYVLVTDKVHEAENAATDDQIEHRDGFE